MSLVQFNNVYRDAIQSLFGTRLSADEIIQAAEHFKGIMLGKIQSGGGTFFDVPAKLGMDEWEFVEKIYTHFQEQNFWQTALARGDCLFSYQTQKYDVIKATIREMALLGLNEIQNFHGLNDPNMTKSVARACSELRAEEGLDIHARGTICIEDNRNITIESCLEFAEELINQGHEGFYLKSASGVVSPEFVRDLSAALMKRFPDQSIDLHVHSTYGNASECYKALIEEGVKRQHKVGIDVQHQALAGLTSHPDILEMYDWMKNHPDPEIQAQTPDVDVEAINADMQALLEMRYLYHQYESSYNPRLVEAMKKARAPGGASSTLSAVPGLLDSLKMAYGIRNREMTKTEWEQIQIDVYEMQAKILDDIGDPTQVTPYAFITTAQAAQCLLNEKSGMDRFGVLRPDMAGLLVGQLGKIPKDVNPALQKKALNQLGLDNVVEYVPACDRLEEKGLPEAQEKLQKAGIQEPSIRQMISASMLKLNPVGHVLAVAANENEPPEAPQNPYGTVIPSSSHNWIKDSVSTKSEIVDALKCEIRGATLRGVAVLEYFAQNALRLKRIDDGAHSFPDGDELAVARLRHRYASELHRLAGKSIPQSLKSAGIKGFHPFRSAVRQAWAMEPVQTLFREACEHRGPGVYEFAQDIISSAKYYHKPVINPDVSAPEVLEA